MLKLLALFFKDFALTSFKYPEKLPDMFQESDTRKNPWTIAASVVTRRQTSYT
jgi:hypothetical protein